jgi:MscS family membrane protein
MLEQYISNELTRAFVVFVISLTLIRTSLFFSERILLKLSSKTKTDIDDKLISKLSLPLSILAFLFALVLGTREISFSEGNLLVIHRVIYSITVIVCGYIAYAIVNILAIRFLRKIALKTKSNLDEGLLSLINALLNITLIVLSLIYILGMWGVQITPLLAGLGIAGLAVALALQPVLSNIFSGVSMILDASIRVGDLVYLDSATKGKIMKVGLRSTKIITFDNELIIIPNNKLADSTIQNVALPSPTSRVVIPFGVEYGSNIEKVKKIVMNELKSLKDITKKPEPTIRFVEMGSSSLNFKAYFYVNTFENRFSSIDEANTKIYNALNKNKIGIPFPQMDVHLKKK